MVAIPTGMRGPSDSTGDSPGLGAERRARLKNSPLLYPLSYAPDSSPSPSSSASFRRRSSCRALAPRVGRPDEATPRNSKCRLVQRPVARERHLALLPEPERQHLVHQTAAGCHSLAGIPG